MSLRQQKQQRIRTLGRPEMTRKEALVVLYRLDKAYAHSMVELDFLKHTHTLDTSEYDAFRRQVRQALRVLTTAVHGPLPTGSLGLCEQCHLHYAPLVAWYHNERHWLESCHCCQACYQQLQQRYTLLTEEQVDKELGL